MEEMLDTFDINGNFLGVKTRSFCHSDNPGVYHKPVWIWIINDNGEVLVQKRAMTKKEKPGKWDMPAAGHVDAGESSIDGCVRETEEELGVRCNPEEFEFLREWIKQDGFELAQVYLLRLNKKIEELKLQIEEVEQIKWLKFGDFVKLLYSDEFCDFEKEYKDWVCEMLKRELNL